MNISLRNIGYLLSAFTFATLPVRAQQNPKSMHFETVTIRPALPDSREIPTEGLFGDSYILKNSPLKGVVVPALFDRGKVPSGFSDSLPSWVREERFNLTAKISNADYEALQRETHDSAPTIPQPMLHEMLFNMLVERCNLLAHHTSTVIHEYSLEPGKHGINPKKLKVSAGLDGVPANAVGNGEWRSTFTPASDGFGESRTFYNMTMAEFARHVSSAVVVHDNTGLTGRYNFSVELLNNAHGPAERYDVSPLGLQWKTTDVVTDNVVIDHIDHPTPN